jgi:hypothetical protein
VGKSRSPKSARQATKPGKAASLPKATGQGELTEEALRGAAGGRKSGEGQKDYG